jgi:hypothetical protein
MTYHDCGQRPAISKVYQREIVVRVRDNFTGSILEFTVSRSLTDVDELTSLRQEAHARLDQVLDNLRVHK